MKRFIASFTLNVRQEGCLWIPSKRVFSSQQAENSARNEDVRTQLLNQSLQYVSQYGWSNECLVQATKDLGLPPLTHRIVRRGSPELVSFVMEKKRFHVQSTMDNFQKKTEATEGEYGYGHVDNDSATFGKGSYGQHSSSDEFNEEQLRQAILSHFEYLRPYFKNWSEAIAISLDPEELPYSVPSLFSLVDDLCYYANIKSSRFDWYLERALMTYLYCSTELHLVTDDSIDFQETRLDTGYLSFRY
jgi:rpsU-divergently transcribed protein